MAKQLEGNNGEENGNGEEKMKKTKLQEGLEEEMEDKTKKEHGATKQTRRSGRQSGEISGAGRRMEEGGGGGGWVGEGVRVGG